MPRQLSEYDRKRDFSATPEPKGRVQKSARTLSYVIQKHRATRLHYDFRLEADGVLASWAIPKGPSLDPKDKRLAMHVEDHPLEYGGFEGTIPKGNYGAGEVIVWDRGTYTLAEGTDPAEEIANGKIKFILTGQKLHGMFSLVKIKNRAGESGEPWLLIKDHDEFVDPTFNVDGYPASAISGKTIADMAGDARAKQWRSSRALAPPAKRAAVTRAKADPLPREIKPMLATLVDAPFDDKHWLFEVKWDGYRALATIDAHGKVKLVSRNGLDLLARFPEFTSLASAFRSLPVIVDGEICALDNDGKSSFQALQEAQESKGRKHAPPPGYTMVYVVFDCLYADGRDLRALPLEERKAKLEALFVEGHGAIVSKHVVGDGIAFYGLARREGLEGIIGKRRDAPYRATRSREWVKIKAKLEEEFVIGGWTEPKGSRAQFGALLLGVYEGKKFVFVGQVGTGFTEARLREIGAELRKREVKTAPFEALPRQSPAPHFVKPELVAQVAFSEWTRDGLLRQPVFLGLRFDKPAREVTRERAEPAP